jgi:CDP-diacylglycerol--glycerol-3-phosphate 3-phosphatidyltransferase
VNQLFNLATKITFARILLIPVFMFFLLAERVQPVGLYIAVGIFAVAALSDTVDGYIARYQKQVTVMGKFLDPLADKLLISAALIALVELQRLSSWVAIVIITREFAVSGLRLIAAAEGRVIDASLLGKIKTVSQIAAVIAVIINLPVEIAGKSLGWILMAGAVILTIASGIDYFVRAKDVLEPLANQKKVS